MKGQGKLLAGVVAGAGAMYLLDPDRGPRRRSLLRDQGIHLGHKLGDGLSATARDARNRTLGTAAELRARFRQEQADDEILHDRIRSAIGRVVTHPGAIEVVVTDGRVTLQGHVLADELDRLIERVEQVRGVSEVQNELEVHRSAEGVPSLQGSGRAREERPELLQENWAPATRLLMGVAGSLLVVRGFRARGRWARVLKLSGVGLLTRAASNVPPHRLVRLATGGEAIRVEKTISVRAPLAQVWALWSEFENFPRFMAHLQEVRKLDEGRSHWVAAGPAGIPVEWDAVITDWVPNQFIGWKSVEGSTVDTTGQVRFRSVSDSETQIDVQLAYSPPAGAAGHVVATLFGTDPKSAMDEDLVRFKSLLEDGRTRADGQPVHLEEVAAEARPARKRAPSRRTES
jgi:uncharacterized membrane protein